MPEPTTLLRVHGLSARYGHNPALQDISFDLASGHSLAIAGSNGAGKTTLLNAIAGLAVPGQRLQGQLEMAGQSYALAVAQRGVRQAISLVPERAKVFGLLSVEDNLRLAARHAPLARQRALEVADIFHWFPRLAERRRTLAGNLSGGEQQMLGIGLALMASPDLLLLDEPTLGLAVPVIEALCQRLETLRRELALTVIVAESDSQWLPQLATRALVLDRGVLVRQFDSLLPAQLEQIHDLMLGINHPAPAPSFQGVVSHV